MICKSCGGDLKHEAHGLCQRCYRAKYNIDHKEEKKEYYITNRDKIKESVKEYRIANRDKIRESRKEYRIANGIKPMNENKKCTSFLGVHVAERVLSKVFKDVQKMPYGHKGFDFICNKGKKIDVKSACTQIRRNHGDSWPFMIKRNKTADYFLCLAFDNRDDLTPLYVWLIPGSIVNHLTTASISESTLPKWDEYKLDINKVTSCCSALKNK